ncbi:hypothetical protein Emtol_0643 [Emticicia oligotrophica DSM 17448]|uniref:Uncharacterized protein n=1 Tax=Emticicia oligotrophica (strain DSM 17448 / CIP 109782 / MTCC 6937 / GPTSA100-15) TaxID=929562 RepID=A0ABM5MXE4_EMTOG|nr:hypothetical protein [Emticicia oligotrophica]AFK01796.1 hypothetical protein Emtol_0643 [Emticicia oligotrophica DSM 17448]
MPNITRQTFLKQCLGIGSMFTLSPYFSWAEDTDTFLQNVVKANNQEVEKLLKIFEVEITEIRRRLGFDFANLSAAIAEPTSRYYQKTELIPAMTRILKFLIKFQKVDGTLDLGNLASPPDTAFILEPLCVADRILRKISIPALNNVKELLKDFILEAGEAMRTGGVHTPNHRWVISAALARINDLYPDKKYVRRIDEWLSEYIFIDADGHYLERSMIYGEVTDNCLITMARLLNRPKLYDYVRKNLRMSYYYMEPNGEMVTNDSRRQDQFIGMNALPFYLDYRHMAIHDNDTEFAAISKQIEQIKGFEEKNMPDLLAFLTDDADLRKPLPKPAELNTNFEQFFKTTSLARIRRKDTTLTIFGGTDKPTIIASGRSTSPSFFSYRKGEAILKYMRFSTDFFSTGYFRSDGLKKEGNQYILSQKIEAPYYQPLPDEFKRADGNYQHSPSTDGRFWNKMDFENRPQSNIKTIETTISIEEKNGLAELLFNVKGAEGVKVTIEFCFREGGEFIGLKKLDDADNYTLESGTGEYKFGKDSIKFGDGIFKHSKLRGLEGEMYTSHFGSLRTEGMHVFLTGIVPFKHKITLS